MSDAPEKSPRSTRPHRIPRLIRNWVSLVGAILAGSAIFAFVMLFAIDLFAEHANPYMGILAYVVAPVFFFTGLGLMAIGYLIQRRYRSKTKGEPIPLVLSIDFANRRHRRVLGGFVGGTVGFLFLTAFGSYQTYHMTETVTFCGETCHESMEPQNVTYQHSQHAKVDCVACHVGPGATEYIKTKVNGVRQLYHTMRGDWDRPIRLHQRDRRPSQETCESCHWREKFTGTVQKVLRHYLADETNTPWTVLMQLNVGGGDPVQGAVNGIHWHMTLANRVEFVSSDDGHTIPWVRTTNADGEVTVYRTPDFTSDPAETDIHTMDCMDCHNRPAHKFPTPNNAVDQALATGKIDRAIPWAKLKAVEALVQPYQTKPEALQKIEQYLRGEYPDDPRADGLVTAVQEIYSKSFFPEMKADWRAYPDHLSHKDWPGCFRCHDGSHKAEDGEKTIKASDCTTCHTILAQGSTVEELEKLNAKGYDFLHVDFEYEDFDCADCHNGANQEE